MDAVASDQSHSARVSRRKYGMASHTAGCRSGGESINQLESESYGTRASSRCARTGPRPDAAAWRDAEARAGEPGHTRSHNPSGCEGPATPSNRFRWVLASGNRTTQGMARARSRRDRPPVGQHGEGALDLGARPLPVDPELHHAPGHTREPGEVIVGVAARLEGRFASLDFSPRRLHCSGSGTEPTFQRRKMSSAIF